MEEIQDVPTQRVDLGWLELEEVVTSLLHDIVAKVEEEITPRALSRMLAMWTL